MRLGCNGLPVTISFGPLKSRVQKVSKDKRCRQRMLFHGLFFPNSKRHCPMCILVSLPIQVHGRLGHKRAAGKEKQGHSADSASLQTPNGCSVSCFSKQLCMKLLLGVVCTSCCSSGDFMSHQWTAFGEPDHTGFVLDVSQTMDSVTRKRTWKSLVLLKMYSCIGLEQMTTLEFLLLMLSFKEHWKKMEEWRMNRYAIFAISEWTHGDRWSVPWDGRGRGQRDPTKSMDWRGRGSRRQTEGHTGHDKQNS